MYTKDDHATAVKAIAAQVAEFHQRKQPFRIYHGSTNSTRIVRFDRSRMLDTSALDHVLAVDEARQVALVEPNVPMDALVAATTPHGLVPPVVMEFPGITAGGGVAGVAGESSSWKWGFFDRIVNWCEVVLPDGEVVRADAEGEHADLFRGAAGAYGTLGVATLFEIRLVPARRFVELEYVTADGVAGAATAIRAAMEEGRHEYIDGILFAPDRGAVMLGRMVDAPSKPEVKTRRFSRAWDNWFYLHADAVTRKAMKKARTETTESGKGNGGGESAKDSAAWPTHVEVIPLTDYLFRYDRGAFWTGRYAFTRFHTPFDRVSRLLLDPLMHTRRMYAALNTSGFTQQYIIQDLALPFDDGGAAAAEFVGWVDREAKTYPLWLCPLRVEDEEAVPLRAKIGGGKQEGKTSGEETSPADSAVESGGTMETAAQAATTTPTGIEAAGERGEGAGAQEKAGPYYLLNVGVWGPGPREAEPFIKLNRALEAEVRRLGGFKWLYANAYYTEEEFWQIYDKAWYDGLRKKYKAGTLPNVYDKVKAKEERVPISGLRGIKTAVFAGTSGKHLLGK